MSFNELSFDSSKEDKIQESSRQGCKSKSVVVEWIENCKKLGSEMKFLENLRIGGNRFAHKVPTYWEHLIICISSLTVINDLYLDDKTRRAQKCFEEMWHDPIQQKDKKKYVDDIKVQNDGIAIEGTQFLNELLDRKVKELDDLEPLNKLLFLELESQNY